MHDKEFEYLECEKRYVFFLLMFVGGFLGGFTYNSYKCKKEFKSNKINGDNSKMINGDNYE